VSFLTNLCTICNSANNNSYPPGDCFLCNNLLESLDQLLHQASEQIVNEHCESFAIATRFPDEWLIKEEELWDKQISKAESLKTVINKKIANALAESTGKQYDAINGDIRVIFEFKKGRVKVFYENLFIFGRYKKLVGNLSQSRWLCWRCRGHGCKKCDNKGKFYTSVEELIGDVFKEYANASNYSLHASGREDVDATNSAGRPFVIEIINPKNRRLDLDKITSEINADENVCVENLKLTNRAAVELVSNSSFDKEYIAEVEFDKDMGNEDIKKIESLGNVLIEQRTPERVSHRRADLIRKRRVKEIEVVKHEANKATIRILAEAGTYIKELINGDNERTKPNIANLLTCSAKCTSLNVSKIYDGFLDLCI